MNAHPHPVIAARLRDLSGAAPAFLASVQNVEETVLALQGGASIIDVKDPSTGALGAAPDAEVCAIVQWVAEHTGSSTPVSATVGDLPLDPSLMVKTCAARATTGVDIVKVGLPVGPNRAECIHDLRIVADKHPVMAVLFGDQEVKDPRQLTELISQLAQARFLGVMIDTADKKAGSLTMQWSVSQCVAFVELAKASGLVCGLAGSLGFADIPSLAGTGADVLGFRGALCHDNRAGALDLARVRTVAGQLSGQQRA